MKFEYIVGGPLLNVCLRLWRYFESIKFVKHILDISILLVDSDDRVYMALLDLRRVAYQNGNMIVCLTRGSVYAL